jgi:hypothetical protein
MLSEFLYFFGTFYLLKAMLSVEKKKIGDMVIIGLSILANPGILFVDHIHFQYNSMLYGIQLLSIACFYRVSIIQDNIVGTISGRCHTVCNCFEFQAHLPIPSTCILCISTLQILFYSKISIYPFSVPRNVCNYGIRTFFWTIYHPSASNHFAIVSFWKRPNTRLLGT